MYTDTHFWTKMRGFGWLRRDPDSMPQILVWDSRFQTNRTRPWILHKLGKEPTVMLYFIYFSLVSYLRLAYFERVSVFLTQENLVSQIRSHYTMQVKLYLKQNCGPLCLVIFVLIFLEAFLNAVVSKIIQNYKKNIVFFVWVIVFFKEGWL